MDALTEWLRIYQSEGLMLYRADIRGDWAFAVPQGVGIVFHIMHEGNAWLRMPNRPPRALGKGDLIVLTGGAAHELAHTPETASVPVADLMRQVADRNEHAIADTTVFCGEFRPDKRSGAGGLKALPSLIHMTPDCLDETPEIGELLKMIAAEAAHVRPGAHYLAQYLADALFVYILRACAKHVGHAPGWLPAMQDRYLSKAFTLMHAEPGAQWTVGKLAKAVGLSRAAFARRFNERVGQAPLKYLTSWRMTIASQLLMDMRGTTSFIAEQVGYSSATAFSRAFKKHMGVAPAGYGRKHGRTVSTESGRAFSVRRSG